GMEPPGSAPYVRLSAPSGEIWEFNEPDEQNRVEGDAVDFCHVVTQGRNIADVNLTVVGEPAEQWMAIAQCFAGPPEDPPAPGSRTANFQG
ncbi:MAG: TIGR03084 family protein, partial [Gammaproteobacteria bacterium]